MHGGESRRKGVVAKSVRGSQGGTEKNLMENEHTDEEAQGQNEKREGKER